jgi:hypothetical protein
MSEKAEPLFLCDPFTGVELYERVVAHRQGIVLKRRQRGKKPALQ